MKILIIGGNGEVGRTHAEILSRKYTIYTKDLGPLQKFGEQGEALAFDFSQINGGLDLMLIALNFNAIGRERFLEISRGYIDQYKPKHVNILSTVSPGISVLLGPGVCHSTTRGLHPNLAEGLLRIAKHIGGPDAAWWARLYESVGIRCITHKKAIETEVAHILNNSAYGVSLMFADEAARICREYGVDYYEVVMRYTSSHNQGFKALGHERQMRPILMPPCGRIGGHCVQQGATLIPEDKRGWLLDRLAHYNDDPATVSVVEKPLAPESGGCVITQAEIIPEEANGTERAAS